MFEGDDLLRLTPILKKIAGIALKLLGLLFVAFIVSCEWYYLPIGAGAVRQVDDLVDPYSYNPAVPGSHRQDLPARVTITIDGLTATFFKGTVKYNQLVALLHRFRNGEITEDPNISESFTTYSRCGQIVVNSFGIPFHFGVYRFCANPNYYWVLVPIPSGMGGLQFADDGKLIKLLKDPH
jgi:hypothetical protein